MPPTLRGSDSSASGSRPVVILAKFSQAHSGGTAALRKFITAAHSINLWESDLAVAIVAARRHQPAIPAGTEACLPVSRWSSLRWPRYRRLHERHRHAVSDGNETRPSSIGTRSAPLHGVDARLPNAGRAFSITNSACGRPWAPIHRRRVPDSIRPGEEQHGAPRRIAEKNR